MDLQTYHIPIIILMGFLNSACLTLVLLDWRRSHIARGLASQDEGVCEFIGRQLREK